MTNNKITKKIKTNEIKNCNETKFHFTIYLQIHINWSRRLLLTKHGTDGSSHQHSLRAVVHLNIDDARPDGLTDLGPQKYGTHCLKDGGQDACLAQGHHPRAHRRTEWVGYIIGAHRERQDESDDEA